MNPVVIVLVVVVSLGLEVSPMEDEEKEALEGDAALRALKQRSLYPKGFFNRPQWRRRPNLRGRGAYPRMVRKRGSVDKRQKVAWLLSQLNDLLTSYDKEDKVGEDDGDVMKPKASRGPQLQDQKMIMQKQLQQQRRNHEDEAGKDERMVKPASNQDRLQPLSHRRSKSGRKQRKSTSCTCPKAMEDDVVCGEDGRTYASECRLRCRRGRPAMAACRGRCPCPEDVSSEEENEEGEGDKVTVLDEVGRPRRVKVVHAEEEGLQG